MKPLQLTATAFGPFGGTIDIDFEQLAGLGLFVVSGDTGAGKTSIFDALFYGLYGTLPGDRRRDQHVRSDHATAHQECEVTVDFLAGGESWRVCRKPTQTRAKRRGGGVTVVKASASLARLVGDSWEPVAAGVLHVDKELGPLVGLTAAQFERVVLLPQGHFRRVLDATSAEREDLLRTLFGSELFEQATADLQARARALTEQCRDQRQRRDADLRRVAAVLQALEPTAAPASNVRYLESADPTGRTTIADDDPPPTIAAIRALIERADTNLLKPLRSDCQMAERSVVAARSSLDQAQKDHALILERDRLRDEQELLNTERPQWEQRRAALLRAREVVAANRAIQIHREYARSHRAQRSALAAAIRATNNALSLAEVDQALDDVDDLDAGIDAAVDAAIAALDQRERAVQAARDDLRAVDELDALVTTGESDRRRLDTQAAKTKDRVARIERELGQLDARRQALGLVAVDAGARTSTATELQEQVHRCEAVGRADAHAAAVAAQVADQTAQLEALDADIAALDRTIAEAAGGEAKLSIAKAGLEALARAADRAQRLDELATNERRLAVAAQEATDQAASVYAAFLADTAPQLAERLVDGEPCAVCGATEHPAPAVADAHDAYGGLDAAAVSAAAAAAEQATADLTRVRAELAVLLEAHEGAGTSTEDLASEQARLRADIATAEAQQRAGTSAQRALVPGQRDRTRVGEDLEATRNLHADACAEVARLRGSLGDDAGDIATLRLRLAEAERARNEAQDALAELDHIVTQETSLAADAAELSERLTQVEQNIAALELDLRSRRDRAAELRTRIESALITTHVDRATETVAAARVALLDVRDRSRHIWQSAHDLMNHEQAAVQALADADCASADQAAAAAMTPEAISQGTAELQNWDEHYQRCRAALELAQRHDLPVALPDVHAATHALEVASSQHRTITQRLTVIDDRLAQCVAEADRIDRDVRDSAQQVAAADVAARVAGVVAGDNDHRVSLEGWVLAAHLRRVVDHANVHLQSMCAGRYSLTVAETPADQRSRHGLDLVVEDAFTGATRPTRSLSGGESFQASLALALGLGDVVCSQRSSLHIDAIFIDEGFGTLDAGSVDQAIDVLDSLRSTGATIGVITHVDAVKAALPTGLQVLRSDGGGSIVRHAA